jgi:hypothetical protein
MTRLVLDEKTGDVHQADDELMPASACVLVSDRVPTPADLAGRLARLPRELTRLTVTDSRHADEFGAFPVRVVWPDGADQALAQLRQARADMHRRYRQAGKTRSTR